MKGNDSHMGKIRRIVSKKRLALLLSMILIFTFVVGGTLAYLFVTVGPITNTFEPAKVSCVVSADQAQVTNTSETSVWLRVSITAVYRSTSDANTIHWENPNISVSDTTNIWFHNAQGDGFYYYKIAVSPNGIVTLPQISINESAPAGFKLEKQVLAEVIQSAPLDAVQEAWGMTRSGENWQTYTP